MEQRKIIVVNYQESWPTDFKSERTNIDSALDSENLIAIHHIGSTSVPGLCAKPIIDILLEVKSLEKLDTDSPNMEALGYLAKGEFGIAGRRYFQKGGIQRTHQVHAFEQGSPEALRHLAFRDYLLAFPLIKDEYGNLKKQGAAMCNNDIEKYIAYKNGFIQHHEKKAIAWAINRNAQ
jgi:GrpB-like predicted nucleotidyltransferase (UPF0157 family)